MPREKTITTPSEDEMRARDELRAIEAAVAAGTELEPLAESAALNKLLLRNARQSLVVISQKTGIKVEEVAERLTALLDNPSWRDDLMEEKLLLAEVAMLVDDIRDRMSRYNVEDEGWASMARVQLAAIKTMLEQVEKRRKAVNGELAVVTQLQAQLFAEAIKIASERAVLNIERKYPDLDPEIIYAEFDAALPEAIAYLEARADA